VRDESVQPELEDLSKMGQKENEFEPHYFNRLATIE